MDNGAEQTAPELRTLQQKVAYMVEKTFPGQKVSGRAFADLVKERGGSLSHSYFSNILAGKVTQPSEDILKALGLGFGVDWRFFEEESEVVDDVVAGLRFLAQRRTGEITGVAARGAGDEGLPANSWSSPCRCSSRTSPGPRRPGPPAEPPGTPAPPDRARGRSR